MAAEDWIDDYPGDEEDNASDCRLCGKPIFLVAETCRRWALYDYYTGERHHCTAAVDAFPVDEAE